jgi:TIR domain
MKVFISYSQESTAHARKVGEALRKIGLDAWLYSDEILPGDNAAEEISQAIKESDAMVVLLSPEALASNTVRSEINYALGKKRFSGRLIPVIIGSEEGFRDKGLPWILRTLNPIEMPESGPGEDEGVRQIAEALQAVA